jgi:hypothetical protein
LLEKSQSQCNNQQDKIKVLKKQIDELNLDYYKKQIDELMAKIAVVTCDLKAETLERQSLLSHQEQIKDTMKHSSQKQTAFEQELSRLREQIDKVQGKLHF